jgi:hypothetical protein
MISRLIYCAFAIVILAGVTTTAQPAPKLNNLLIYGNGYMFGVKEPDGWHGDTDQIASKYQVNVVFLPPKESRKNDVTIRVRVNHKTDENTIEDLEYDMQGYRKEYPAVQFSDLKISHDKYKTFARTAYIPKSFYEYVAYLNPGTGNPYIFSVAMSKRDEPATEAELKAFESILKSLVWLSATPTDNK